MTRGLFALAAGLVFVAGFILDPAGLAQLAYVCVTGGCGIRPVWLAIALGAGGIVWLSVALARRIRAQRSSRRKPRAAGHQKPRAAGRRKPGPATKARRTPRRKSPAGA